MHPMPTIGHELATTLIVVLDISAYKLATTNFAVLFAKYLGHF